ncbi:PH domain-containing protein [Pseudoalteromonas sp. SR44-5]|uniref:PH domain-containing protein n=1 Tax=unclassified Pseudoalteromonas TaxID=194690 RepID=UPI0016014111|nr:MULTISPECIES: PH domain-containing protein [unclassified Pseudoalteromonas]MBB1334868.1 PH domain-containing protein [Pseudoalteromonas sp. SR41-6]MBB1343095.1 PH domain-containing protein [Pseudoalteromonas sp. SR45-6]MBB1368346.1 PH domain-containing protein [Pseudoalteromonas sp. SR44-5]MBB1419002.1 PH domain-containing protein [Pseudoalteromonas sp. SG44-1]MBB1423698.1 PH domain-containing protein [Pseudoalteromonas sp. SG43-7]
MSTPILKSAKFDSKVKSYWVVLGVITCVLCLVGIPFIPFVAFIIWLVAGRILAAMSANLLERKLVVKRGVFFKEEKSIPLEKITDVGLSQGPLMRLFGLYRLSFETAGQSGHGALVSLLGVVDASEFREAILTQKDNLTAQQSTTKSADHEPQSQVELIRALTYSVKNIEQMLVTMLDDKK